MAYQNGTTKAPEFFERLNYFFGKLLTVRDFQTEQRYFNEKRWLLNRQAVGRGVVRGMEVRDGGGPDNNLVTVSPGLALDAYGNEIYVGKSETFELYSADSPPTEQTEFYVCIRYKEAYSEPAPAPTFDCEPDKTECHYSRITERFEFEVREGESDDQGDEDVQNYGGMLADSCCKVPNPCQPRAKNAWLKLAKVTHLDGKIIHIDNCGPRKWVWSNDMLASLLRETTRRANSSRPARTQSVPLLAQTIKGVSYRNGRLITVTDYWQDAGGDDPAHGRMLQSVGVAPHDITTDGEYVWFTDAESEIIEEDGEPPKSVSLFKMNRDCIIENEWELPGQSWGVAFDGNYMWVTHHEADRVSKIPAVAACENEQVETLELEPDSCPKDVIYAGDYLWIARQGGVTRIDVITHETANFTSSDFTPHALAYDGDWIWLVGDKAGSSACTLMKFQLDEPEEWVDPGISATFGEPKSLVFDGENLWVTHNDGVSMIDVNENEFERKAGPDSTLTAAAFDGEYLWVAEPDDKSVHRVDIHAAKSVSRFRITEKMRTYRNFTKMCFDGMHVWMTDHVDSSQGKTGVIYRMLA